MSLEVFLPIITLQFLIPNYASPATTDTRDNLNQTIVFVRDEFLQVFTAIKLYHRLTLLSKNGNMDSFCKSIAKLVFTKFSLKMYFFL